MCMYTGQCWCFLGNITFCVLSSDKLRGGISVIDGASWVNPICIYMIKSDTVRGVLQLAMMVLPDNLIFCSCIVASRRCVCWFSALICTVVVAL